MQAANGNGTPTGRLKMVCNKTNEMECLKIIYRVWVATNKRDMPNVVGGKFMDNDLSQRAGELQVVSTIGTAVFVDLGGGKSADGYRLRLAAMATNGALFSGSIH
jgi:hypothetical protein